MRFKSLSILALSAVVLSSCLKSKDSLGILDDKGTIIAEFQDISEHGSPHVVTLEANPPTETINLINLRYHAGGDAQPSGPVRVKLELDDAAVIAAGLTPLPANAYTLPAMEFEIPASAARNFAIPITLNKTLLDLSKSYGLGLTIAEVNQGVISGTAGTAVINLLVKNPYDGVYSVEDGFVQRYTSPGSPEALGGLNGSIVGNPDVSLATVGSHTVQITGLQWAAGSGSGVAGIDNLRLTVDPATNQVTMFALGNATLANWEGRENRYDPATKTFYLNFRWNPTANRREYSMTIKYDHPR